MKTTNGGGYPFYLDDKTNNSNYLKIFPNPASNTITISIPTPPYKNTIMTLYSVNGKQLLTQRLTEQGTVVDVSGLPVGVYFVRVTDDGTVMVGKFLKQ